MVIIPAPSIYLSLIAEGDSVVLSPTYLDNL